MQKHVKWIPYTWTNPQDDWERIDRNLAIATFNIAVACVIFAITLGIRIWRLL